MGSEALRMAVVGVGHFGRYHAQKVAQSPHAELVGVIDQDGRRAAEVGAELDVPSYADADGLIDELDAVSIAVPTMAHHAVAKSFLARGIHVLLEKPIADNLDAADELIATARHAGAVLQVGHLPRFSGAVAALSKHLSHPLFIESLRIAPFKPRGTDVNVILDLMIHDIDFILSLIDAPIATIDAAGAPVFSASEDIANARVKFETGCIANITASRVSLKTERQMRIFQRDAYIAVDFDKRKTRIVRKGDHAAGGLLPNIDITEESYEEVDELEREIDSFVNAVRTGTPPLVSGEDGRHALEAAIMITDSLRTNWEIVKAASG